MDAMRRIPWILKTCQTMGKAGMPLSSITAMTFPRLGSTRARASAEGIPSGANSLCTGEEIMWSPWGLIAKVHQGKAHLIHMQQRKDICSSLDLIGGCSFQNRAEPSSLYHCGEGLGIQRHSGHIFRPLETVQSQSWKGNPASSILSLLHQAWWPLLEPIQGCGT